MIGCKLGVYANQIDQGGYSLGQYLKFDGTDDLVSTNKKVLNSASQFVIHFRSIKTSIGENLTFGESANFTGNNWYVYHFTDGHFYFFLDGGSNYIKSDNSFGAGEHSVLFGFDNGACSLFVGDSVEPFTTFGVLPTTVNGFTAGSFLIGRPTVNSGSDKTNCGIDNFLVKIGDTATLSKAQDLNIPINPLIVFPSPTTFVDFNNNVTDLGTLGNTYTLNNFTPPYYLDR